jgi:hypothetical protein
LLHPLQSCEKVDALIFRFGVASIVCALALVGVTDVSAQSRLAGAKSLRCSFPRNATGTWTKDGAPEAAVRSTPLMLRFDTIDADGGTAQLRNGTVGSEVTVRLAEGYLHFMQAFRTGPLYTTTVFDVGETSDKLKAVHSRHEYFSVPLPGATSSPEQYYGECEILPDQAPRTKDQGP